ncbi:hypothetical protein [Mycobacterium lepromatosis]|uniref:hypothetical protein n=1 Tax=Mycobacterium lepromatosis TaxID=480418 RepID=UPI000678EE55|nr:hypothetical protein [Mycobacterium lepromatosis]
MHKTYYNITITGLLAAVALRIVNVELFSLFADPFAASRAGFVTVEMILTSRRSATRRSALFVITWAITLMILRYGRIEEQWASPESAT